VSEVQMNERRLVLPPHVQREQRGENVIDIGEIKRAAKAATTEHKRPVPTDPDEAGRILGEYTTLVAKTLDRLQECVKKKRNPTPADLYTFAESMSSYVSLQLALIQGTLRHMDAARVNVARHLKGYAKVLMDKGLVTDAELSAAMDINAAEDNPISGDEGGKD